MKVNHYIGMDAHCGVTELRVLTPSGRVTHRWRGPTTIPALSEAISAVPRPRFVAVEEGGIADWLLRSLSPLVDDFIICDPRRNHLISHEGDKDDGLDAQALADLLRGGFLKRVHHPKTFDRIVFKQRVALYHRSVRQRVRQANQIMGFLRYHGVFVRESVLANLENRTRILSSLPPHRALRSDVKLLWRSYDRAVDQVKKMRHRMIRLARQEDIIVRFRALPGVEWIRASTLVAYLDTPWRFKSKSALWRYLGIGLERSQSGNSPAKLRVARDANRLLKDTILGAAQTAIRTGENPFAEQYERWLDDGVSLRNARRNVARSMAAVMWGMWKTGSAYEPTWVGATEPARKVMHAV